MVMPYVTAGSQNPGQRELDFCIHYRYETQKAILSDLVASLYAQGYRKMVIINGHGGNTFKSMIRDLSLDYPDFHDSQQLNGLPLSLLKSTLMNRVTMQMNWKLLL